MSPFVRTPGDKLFSHAGGMDDKHILQKHFYVEGGKHFYTEGGGKHFMLEVVLAMMISS